MMSLTPVEHSNTSANYYQNRRENIAQFISKGNNRILDIGCGAGNFGSFLKQNNYASEVIGIEIDRTAADEALTKLDQVHCADLNRTRISELLIPPTNSFDFVVCADVLEHLIDPWQTLYDLSTHLTPTGKLVASIPNVRHWTVWLPLIMNGKWNYVDAGIMDRTHLRFFTKISIQELFTTAGLDIIELRPLIGGKWKLVDQFSLQLLRDFITVQWVIVGTHKATSI
ncbi:MAG: class I SAM-dependent methyltransferase [Desulfobulbaceae bacterium]|nr:class I SAM-dependent methyltransferase [Desulfobulbaceae bacterium]